MPRKTVVRSPEEAEQHRIAQREYHREAKRRWRAANPDRAKASALRSSRKWREANPDKAREATRRWREANPDKVHARNRRYYEANAEIYKERAREWRASNREKSRQFSRNWYANNVDYNKERARRWQRANPEKAAANVAKRRARKICATPAWSDPAKIAQYYQMARALTEYTGVPHHVDHMIPIKGRTVCGLHVETNLRVIPAKENIRKGNRFDALDTPAACPA